jgi:hypothetical protein
MHWHDEGLVFCTGSGIEQEARLESKSGGIIQKVDYRLNLPALQAHILQQRVFDGGWWMVTTPAIRGFR